MRLDRRVAQLPLGTNAIIKISSFVGVGEQWHDPLLIEVPPTASNTSRLQLFL